MTSINATFDCLFLMSASLHLCSPINFSIDLVTNAGYIDLSKRPPRDVDIKTRLISLSVRQDSVLSTCPRCQCIRSGRWNTQDWTMTDQRAVLENNRTRRVAVLLRRLYARLYRYSSHFEQSVVNRDQIMHISTMHLMHAEGDQNRII